MKRSIRNANYIPAFRLGQRRSRDVQCNEKLRSRASGSELESFVPYGTRLIVNASFSALNDWGLHCQPAVAGRQGFCHFERSREIS